MSLRDLGAFPFDVTIYSDEDAFVMRPAWQTNVGVPLMDLLLDVASIELGDGAAVSLIPALQFAGKRTDRPDVPAVITTGSPRSTVGLTHYQETLASPTKLFVRDGVAFKLTDGAYARVQGTLYTSYRSLGLVLPAEEIVVQAGNDSTAKSVYPLGGGKPLLATRVDKARMVAFGYGNANNTMSYQLAARFFNDPLARGEWELIDEDRTPSTTNFEVSTGDVPFTGLTPTSFQWLELGLAVWKAAPENAASRVTFHVIPALTYT